MVGVSACEGPIVRPRHGAIGFLAPPLSLMRASSIGRPSPFAYRKHLWCMYFWGTYKVLLCRPFGPLGVKSGGARRGGTVGDVRFTPKAGISCLFDHLVDEREQVVGDSNS